jgi:hypothetical protein
MNSIEFSFIFFVFFIYKLLNTIFKIKNLFNFSYLN